MNLLGLIQRERVARTQSFGDPHFCICRDAQDSDDDVAGKIAAATAAGRIGPGTEVLVVSWGRPSEP